MQSAPLAREETWNSDLLLSETEKFEKAQQQDENRSSDVSTIQDFKSSKTYNSWRTYDSVPHTTPTTADNHIVSLSSLSSGVSNHLALRGAALSFHHISYTIKYRQYPWKLWEFKTILNDLSGIIKPGMNAIMGGSGSGKTTLLDILAARKDPNSLQGEVLMDGRKQPVNFSCISGYVLQDDILMGSLTVRENLLFSAALRLPNSVHPANERVSRVETLLKELDLVHVANSKIGTELIRGISGGERKRTSIGMELVMDPPVLFLDEPTTGLDASTAQMVMNTLRDMSQRGKTIVFSIHQPKYSIYKQFDTLTLLSRGQMVYHGPAGMQLISYFRTHGYICETFDNPADFILDVLNGELNGFNRIENEEIEMIANERVELMKEHKKESNSLSVSKKRVREFSRHFIRKWKESRLYQQLHRELNKIHHEYNHEETINRMSHSSFYPNSCLCQLKTHSMSFNERQILSTSSAMSATASDYHINHFTTQMKHLAWRSALNIARDPQIWISQSVMFLFFAISMGIVFFQMDRSIESGIQNRMGLFFFSTLQLVFINLSAVEVFIRERQIFIHETCRGFYRTSAYFISKLLCEQLPAKAIPLLLFMPITYFMTGLRHSLYAFIVFELTMLMVNISSCGLALLISATMSSLGLAQISISIVYVFMMVYGGFLLNLNSMAWWVSWCRFFSIFRYSLGALAANEMSHMEFCPFYKKSHPLEFGNTSLSSNMSSATQSKECESGSVYLSTQNIPHSNAWDLWYNIVGLSFISIITYGLTYVQLCRLKKYV